MFDKTYIDKDGRVKVDVLQKTSTHVLNVQTAYDTGGYYIRVDAFPLNDRHGSLVLLEGDVEKLMADLQTALTFIKEANNANQDI